MQQLLKGLLERVEPLFEKGGKLERLYPAYDAFATLAFVLPNRTKAGAHIRDDFDSKRMMVTVIFALIPPTLMGIFNIGFQSLLALGVAPTFLPAVVQGLIRFLPILIITYAVGLGWEFLFAVVRRHEVSEGFLVSGFLIALIVPPTIPWWQLAIATSFGVVIGKEIFGGTGMNIFNPALVVARVSVFRLPGADLRRPGVGGAGRVCFRIAVGGGGRGRRGADRGRAGRPRRDLVEFFSRVDSGEHWGNFDLGDPASAWCCC